MRSDPTSPTLKSRAVALAPRRARSTAVGALLALALLFGSPALGIQQASATSFLDRAQQHFDDGDLSAASVELKNALQRDPDNARARLLLGKVQLELADGLGALKELERAKARGLATAEVEVLIARARLIAGNYADVVEQVPAGLPVDRPETRALTVARAEALARLQRTDEAVIDFERVLAEETVARAHGGLARVAIAREQFEEADRHLKTALSLEPEEVEWLSLRGLSLLRQSRLEEARAAYELFVEDHKYYADGQIGYVRTLIALSDYETARTWLEGLRNSAPSDQRVLSLTSMVELELESFDTAKEFAVRVLAHSYRNRMARFVAGVATFHLGEYEGAHQHLTEYMNSLDSNQHDVRAVYFLSAAKVRLGKPAEAATLLRRYPLLTEHNAAAAALLAQASLQSGDLQTGLQQLERLAEQEPTNAAVQARLGAIRIATGDVDTGIQALESAIEQDPALDEIQQQLVLEHIRAGRLEEALDGALDLTERYPDRAVGYILQATVWLRKGDMGAAENYFRQAQQAEPNNPSAALNVAQLEAREGNLSAAIAVLSPVLESQPGHLQTLLLMADLEGRLGNPDRREKLLRDAVESNSDSVQSRILLARQLMQRNAPRDAIDVLQPALDAGSKNPPLLETAGIAHLMANEPLVAIRHLERLQREQPSSLQAYYLAAQAYNSLGRLRPALGALERALELNESHFASRRLMVTVLQRTRRFEDSLPHLEIAKKQRPTDPNLADLEARAMFVLQRVPEALAAAQRALELAPNSQRAIAIARFYWTDGQQNEAIDSLTAWVAENPKESGAHLVLASFLLETGRRNEAANQYAIAAELEPNSAAVQNDYAWVLWKIGKSSEALERAERALALAPDNARIKDTLGSILIDNDEVDRGLQLLRSAASDLPNDSSVQYHLALGYARAGESGRAMEVLEGILDADQTFDERGEAQALLDSLKN